MGIRHPDSLSGSPPWPTPSFSDFETLSLHAGQRPDPATGARAVPIYQTTSYVFATPSTAAALFNLERVGHIYSRISNPTVAVLEERVAALEGGVGAVATASGQAALHLAIATLMGAGGHIVASAALYGGSHQSVRATPCRASASRRASCRPRDPAGLRAGDPARDAADLRRDHRQSRARGAGLEAVAAIAHEAGLPLLIDSTFATPYLMPPLRAWRRSRPAFGDQMAGRPRHRHRRRRSSMAAASTGRNRRRSFPTMTEPYAGYHGIDFAEEFGPPGLHHARAGRGLARFRRLHEPGQRLPHPAGHRDAAAAHGAPCRQCETVAAAS